MSGYHCSRLEYEHNYQAFSDADGDGVCNALCRRRRQSRVTEVKKQLKPMKAMIWQITHVDEASLQR